MRRTLRALALAAVVCVVLPRPARAIGEDSPGGVVGNHNGSVTTAGFWDPYSGNGKRQLDEIVVPGAIGAYPLTWTRTLNTRPTDTVPRMGLGGWSHSYEWSGWVRFEPPNPPPCPGACDPYEGPEGMVYYPDGRAIEFSGDPGPFYSSSEGDEPGDGLIRTDATHYELLRRDGGRVLFTATRSGYEDALRAYAIVDPYGLTTTLEYDGANRLSRITEPGRRFLQITYVPSGAGAGFIGRVEAFDGQGHVTQWVNYNYTTLSFPPDIPPAPYITSADYSDGTHAYYTYQPGYFGRSFALIYTCDDVRFAGPMKQIEYEFTAGLNNPKFVVGQIKAEKNARTHQIVSQASYPSFNMGFLPPPGYAPLQARGEIRGDGTTRSFQYGTGTIATGAGGILTSFTDFKNQRSYITLPYDPNATTIHRVFTDARTKVTTEDRDPTTNALKQMTFPYGHTVVYGYSDASAPIYLTSRKNENDRYTFYDRDANHRVQTIRYPDGGREEFTYNNFGQVLTHLMTSGGTETFVYDPRGLKISSTAPATPSDQSPQPTQYFYYTSGANTDRLEHMVDPRGNSTFYEYNARGQVTKVRHQDGSYMLSDYNPDGTLAWSADENHPGAISDLNQRTRYEYDEYKRVTAITNPMGERTTKSYRPWSGGDELSHTESFVFHEASPTGKVVDRGWDENHRLKWMRTATGTPEEATTNFTYDEVGNLITTQDPRGNTTTLGYDDRNRKTSVTPPAPFSSQVTNWQYDAVGNMTLEIKPEVRPGVRPARQMEYEAMNRLWKEHEWADQNNALTERVTTYLYFLSGMQAAVIDPKAQRTEFTYDARNQKLTMKYPDGYIVNGWTYDAVGNMTARPTADSTKTQLFRYDNRNRMDQMRWNNAMDFTDFEYDTLGRLKNATNPYSRIERLYDAAGRLTLDRQILTRTLNAPPAPAALTPTSMVSRQSHGAAGAFDIALPLDGSAGTECRNGGASHSYTLLLTFPGPVTVTGASVSAGFGTLTSTSVSGNVVTVNLTDVSNAQTLSVSLALASGATTGQITAPLRVLVGDANGNGTVNASDKSQAQASSGQPLDPNNFRCDVNGNGTINASDIGMINAASGNTVPSVVVGPQVDVTYVPNQDGQVGRLYAPGVGYDLTFAYDNTNRFQKIFGGVNGPLRHEYVYDLAGNVTARLNPVNSTSQVYAYDQRNRLTERTINAMAYDSGNMLATYEFSHEYYGYDALSRLNLTDRRMRWAQSGTIERTGDTFGYNDAAELTAAGYGLIPNTQGQFVNPARAMNYFPDNAGNRLHVDANGTLLATYSPNVLNQYAETSNGSEHEIAGYNNVSYRYLGDTRLKQASSAAAGTYDLGYDALGRCVKRTTNGVSNYYVYDGERPIIEYNGSGTITARNTYGIGMDEILARDTGALFYHQDRLGNVSAVTDAEGKVVEQYRYDAFGTPEIRSGPAVNNVNGNVLTGTLINNRFLFTGREWVPRYGFYEYRNRAYHPGLGRFMSEDPMGFKAGDRNLFRYCGGDPVNRVDPMGLTQSGADQETLKPQIRDPFWEFEKHFDSSNTRQGALSNGSISLSMGQMERTGNSERVVGGFDSPEKAGLAGAMKDYAKVDKSGLGGKDNFEYGGHILKRDSNPKEYGYDGPFQGKQGQVSDQYRNMPEGANYLQLYGKGSIPVPKGWSPAGFHYAHPLPGNTIPNDDKAVARHYGWTAVGIAPSRKIRGQSEIEYYP